VQNLKLRECPGSRGQIAAAGMILQLAAKVGQSMRTYIPIVGTPCVGGSRQARGFTAAQGLLDGFHQPARIG
jgi:hypothetical protein